MKKLAIILCVVCISTQVLPAQVEMAQSVISASGNICENESFSIAWNLGQLAITTLQGENMVLTQGFHQPAETGTGIRKNQINWEISAFPNPFQNELNIQFDIKEFNDFLLEIQDVTGRILIQESHKNVIPGETIIMNLYDFKSGVYFLSIHTPDHKIIKVISLRKL